MSLLQYCLTGLCTGAGTPLFAVLTVTLWRLPDTTTYYRNFRLSLITGLLCLACALLALIYLGLYTAMPRILFVGCLAAGFAIGVLALSLYRWRRATKT